MANLTGKVAVVTGASKGIGSAIAKHLAAAGASVVINYVSSKEGADKVVSAIMQAGGEAIAVRASIAKEADVARLFVETKKAYGKIDILINNAGVFRLAPLETVTVEEYYRQYDTNVLGLLLVTKAAVPLFPETGGSIVNISSIASTLAAATNAIYSGTKGAVDSITKVLAKELGPKNIRVNAINAGVVNTEGMATAGHLSSDIAKRIIATTPLGRIGEPDDIALPAVFLASDDARWITGETIYVSGGLAI